ncbi:hypothetical protein PRK78_004174 [Emydomyces testavorans]|uniref:Siderophore biosynthesis n=1 Tax=Emydomyces testavorans TaxID=2070801 RepID=A0AAF0IJI5_9EURO|nr:hypothetical protein PRK78_004174 [Emydomyces testavorans]
MYRKLLLGLLALATTSILTHAKTDLAGCTTTATMNTYNQPVKVWYVPGTGEVCEILDCGGGRAPPKHSVPGCAGYTGTNTYSPIYLALSTDIPSKTSAATATASTTATTEAVATSSAPARTGTSTAVSSNITSSPAVTGAANTVSNNGSATVTKAPATQTTNAAPGLVLGSGMMAGAMAVVGWAML